VIAVLFSLLLCDLFFIRRLMIHSQFVVGCSFLWTKRQK
jgi:hypothetical protein